jgi:diguanylate cyclase (GGDEF)-like protein/PAS domain S-box-containing protein
LPVSIIPLAASTLAFGASGLALPTLFTALAILALGIAVLVRARASLASVLFFGICAGAAGWLGCFARVYTVEDAAVALEWARFGTFFIGLIPACMFHFAALYHGRERKLRAVIALSWAACLISSFIAAALGTTELRRYSWGWFPTAAKLDPLWGAMYFALIVASVVLLARAARESTGESRKRARALAIAFAIASFAFIDFAPTWGLDVPPLGFLPMLAFVVVSALVVWRYQLVDLTPEYAAGQILATMKGAVIVVDLAAKIRVVNRAAAHMLGYEEQELLGHHLRTIFEASESMNTGQLLHSLSVFENSMRWRTRDGTAIDVSASSSFVRDADGSPVGVVYVAQDVTERLRAEEAVRESERRYRVLFDGNPLSMWVYDRETLNFVAVNDAAVRHYGYSKEEFLRMRITDIRPAEDAPLLEKALAAMARTDVARTFRHRRKDGSTFNVEITSFEFVSGGRLSRLVIAVDVTERMLADERLRESEERYRLLFERNLAGVYRTAVDGRILDCNDALARIFGYPSRDALLQASASTMYFTPEERDRLLQRLREERALSNIETRLRRRDGSQMWALENMTLLGDGVMEGTLIDITERKSAQEQMEYQAYHDVLTLLPNRLLFRDRITVALAHARRSKRSVAVMFLDLDQFKLVNDTLGHTVGDRLLQEVGGRIVNCVRSEDTVARMGGDEFTILLPDIADRHAAATVAQKVLDAISQPLFIERHELFATTSIGIAIYADDGADAETLLKNADRAMYRAKEAGRNNFQFATPASFDAGRLSLERSLHHAFERDEFVVHYQPMVELTTGRVVGAEALIRWRHPEHGLMYPDDFIPIAEECGLIFPLGEWVLRTACTQVKRWHDAGHSWLRIAVNLSPRQFQQRELPLVIERVLEETSYPADLLDVEITESAAMQNAELSLSIMLRLKEMGVRISIDDFGTGYSSLSYLKRFPIDTVKIDQGFVRELTAGSSDGAIITAVISMARALKLRVVAEGVETEEQLAFLQREQCAEIQGFLYSRPVPAEEFEATLARV